MEHTQRWSSKTNERAQPNTANGTPFGNVLELIRGPGDSHPKSHGSLLPPYSPLLAVVPTDITRQNIVYRNIRII